MSLLTNQTYGQYDRAKCLELFLLDAKELIIYPAKAATIIQAKMPTVPSPRPLTLLAVAMASALFLKT